MKLLFLSTAFLGAASARAVERDASEASAGLDKRANSQITSFSIRALNDGRSNAQMTLTTNWGVGSTNIAVTDPFSSVGTTFSIPNPNNVNVPYTVRCQNTPVRNCFVCVMMPFYGPMCASITMSLSGSTYTGQGLPKDVTCLNCPQI